MQACLTGSKKQMTFIHFLEKTIEYYFAYLPRKKPKPVISAAVHLIAHRGAHDPRLGLIENTLAAFDRALNLDCWGIEFDVRTTSDGVLVVNHDATLQRLWGKNVAIRELTFEKLRALVPEIPSLKEVVTYYGKKLHLFIELKKPFDAELALKNDLQTLAPCQDYHLLSLDEALFSSLKLFSTDVMLLVAVHNNVKKLINQCLQKNYGGILGHYLLINNNKVTQLQLANKQVGVGQINSKFGLYRELNRGLSWIFSDNVGLLNRCLSDLTKKKQLTV